MCIIKPAYYYSLRVGLAEVRQRISMLLRCDSCSIPTYPWNSWEVGRWVVVWWDRYGASSWRQCTSAGAVFGPGRDWGGGSLAGWGRLWSGRWVGGMGGVHGVADGCGVVFCSHPPAPPPSPSALFSNSVDLRAQGSQAQAVGLPHH